MGHLQLSGNPDGNIPARVLLPPFYFPSRPVGKGLFHYKAHTLENVQTYPLRIELISNYHSLSTINPSGMNIGL